MNDDPTLLVLDLETVPDPALPDPDPSSKFPAPPHHKIACAGYAVLDSTFHVIDWNVVAEIEESLTLRRLTSAIQTLDPVVVTMNGRGFDLPVIASRCFVHGIPFPWYYANRYGARYRFSREDTYDVMDHLSDFGAAHRAGLDIWARACGWPGKQGMSGASVADMVARGMLSNVADYCMTDVCQTIAILLRAELLRGALSLEDYQVAAQALLERARADVRTATLALRVDIERFLLVDTRISDAIQLPA